MTVADLSKLLALANDRQRQLGTNDQTAINEIIEQFEKEITL